MQTCIFREMENTITANDLKAGMRFVFTPTGREFTLAKVTDTRASWYTEPMKSSWGRNTMRMTWVTLRQFQEGINSGAYVVVRI